MKSRESYCRSARSTPGRYWRHCVNPVFPRPACCRLPARTQTSKIRISDTGTTVVYTAGIDHLHRLWSLTTYHMQSLRDNPACAAEEFKVPYRTFPTPACPSSLTIPGSRLTIPVESSPPYAVSGGGNPGAGSATAGFRVEPGTTNTRPAPAGLKPGPAVGILREQGVNGHVEMAAAFERAGFECLDINMNDLQSGSASLAVLAGLVACGGFSYGDVLGAGGGWAKSILYNDRLRDEFEQFFKPRRQLRPGCLQRLPDVVPAAQHHSRRRSLAGF